MRLITKQDRQQLRQSWINGRKTEIYKDLEILKDVKEYPKKTYYTLIIWRGTAGKPIANYLYSSEALMEKSLEYYKKSADQHAEYKEKQKIKPLLNIENLKKGNLFYTSWGYDQTNYDYIVVLEVSPSGKTVICQRTSALHMGEDCQSNVQEPIFCPFGDKFRLQIRGNGDNLSLVGSYPFCNDGSMDSKRHGYFSRHITGKQYRETMSQYGH